MLRGSRCSACCPDGGGGSAHGAFTNPALLTVFKLAVLLACWSTNSQTS